MAVKDIIESLGIRCIDDHFNSKIDLPYAVIINGKKRKYCADNAPYSFIREIEVELYTDGYRDDELSERIENALDNNGYICETEDDYIAEERLYRVTFSFEEMIFKNVNVTE